MSGGRGTKRSRSEDEEIDAANKLKAEEWFKKNCFDDVGSAMRVNKGFLTCKHDSGVWATTDRLVTDEDLAVLKEELGVGLETRGSRDLRWFGANWQGYGQLEPTTAMPKRSQEIVDKICMKTGFPKVTVSTLHCYYRSKGKKINNDFEGEFKGRKFCIVPHTDDKLLTGNGGVMMLQVTGNAEVVMSTRKGNTSRITTTAERDLGHILVCEGASFKPPHQHSVLWTDDGSSTMMTLTMRSIPLDWEDKPPKIFNKLSDTEGGKQSGRKRNERRENGDGDRDDRVLNRDREDRDRDREDRNGRRYRGPADYENKDRDRSRGPRGKDERYDDRDRRNGRDRRNRSESHNPSQERRGRYERDSRDRRDRRGVSHERTGRTDRFERRDARDESRGPSNRIRRQRSTTRDPSPPKCRIEAAFDTHRSFRSPSPVASDLPYGELKEVYAGKKALWNKFREEFKDKLGEYPSTDDLNNPKLRAKKQLFEQCKELQRKKDELKNEKRSAKKERKEKKSKKEKKEEE